MVIVVFVFGAFLLVSTLGFDQKYVSKLSLVAQAFLPVKSLNTASNLTDKNVCATEAKKL
jgi:hypothetical protein